MSVPPSPPPHASPFLAPFPPPLPLFAPVSHSTGDDRIIYAIMIEDTFPIGVTNTFGFLAGSLYSFVYLRNCWHDKREHVRREAWCIFLGAVVVIA